MGSDSICVHMYLTLFCRISQCLHVIQLIISLTLSYRLSATSTCIRAHYERMETWGNGIMWEWESDLISTEYLVVD